MLASSRRNFCFGLMFSTILTPTIVRSWVPLAWFAARVVLRSVVKNSLRSGGRALASTTSRSTATRSAGVATIGAVATKSTKSFAKSVPITIRSSKSVTDSEKKKKGAMPLNDKKREFIINQAVDFTAESILDIVISNSNLNYRVDRSAAIIGVDVINNNGDLSYLDGGIEITLTNNSDDVVAFDVNSYVFDLDDQYKQDLEYGGVGPVMEPRSSQKWDTDMSEKLYPGRKVIVTELIKNDSEGRPIGLGEIVDVTEQFFVPV